MSELAADAAVPAVATEIDPEEVVSLADDAGLQEIHSSMDLSDGGVRANVVDDPSKREGNGVG